MQTTARNRSPDLTSRSSSCRSLTSCFHTRRGLRSTALRAPPWRLPSYPFSAPSCPGLSENLRRRTKRGQEGKPHTMQCGSAGRIQLRAPDDRHAVAYRQNDLDAARIGGDVLVEVRDVRTLAFDDAAVRERVVGDDQAALRQ